MIRPSLVLDFLGVVGYGDLDGVTDNDDHAAVLRPIRTSQSISQLRFPRSIRDGSAPLQATNWVGDAEVKGV